MPSRNLPPSPSLAHLRSQAKQLLQAVQTGDEDARARFAVLPRFADPSAVDPAELTLADAQSAIAREYGFDSWPRLKHHVETQPTDAFATDALEALAEQLAADPQLRDQLQHVHQRNRQFFAKIWGELSAPLAALATELQELLATATGARAVALRKFQATIEPLAAQIQEQLHLDEPQLDATVTALATGDTAGLRSLLERNPGLRSQVQKGIMPRLAVLPKSVHHALYIQIRSLGESLVNLGVLDAAVDEANTVGQRLARQSRLRHRLHDLQRIIGELADLTDLETRERAVKADVFEVETLIVSCCLKAGERAEAKGLDFSYTVAPTVGDAHTDQHLLGKILNYFLDNAIKFTDQGAIKIHADQHGDQLTIAVSDTGLGIPPERLDRMFAEDAAWTDLPLGLANTRRFAEHLGGHITAASQVDHGSTFTLTIPLQYKEDAHRIAV